MVEAKNLGTFTIEPVGADIYNPDSFMVRKRYQDTESTTTYTSSQGQTMFQDISDEFGSGSTDIGCRIELKNGLYEIDTGVAAYASVEWSTVAEGDHVHFHIEGESRDGVIIRNVNPTSVESTMFLARSNLTLNNLTLDAADTGKVSLVQGYGQNNGDAILEVRNCRLMRTTAFCTRTARPWAGFICENNIYEKPASDFDQIAIGVDKFARITNNYMDRTNGSYNGSGSSITAGGGNNIVVSGNQIKRNNGLLIYGISMEAWDNYDSIFIHNNFVNNGRILIGSTGSWTVTYKNVFVTGNTLYQGGIYVQGPTTGDHTDKIKDVTVENNQLFDSWEAGIYLNKVGGFCTVRNNMIKNSNKSLTTFNGQQPLMLIESCIDPVVENNFLYMGVVSPEDPNFSGQGIRYVNLVNPTIRNNRILNRTIDNKSYLSIGKHTGSVLISRRN
jgi:hypothetical protein